MTNSYLDKTWREKSDSEIIEASKRLNYFYEDARILIRSELQRRGLPIPPTITEEKPEVLDRRLSGILLILLGGAVAVISLVVLAPMKKNIVPGLIASFVIFGYGSNRLRIGLIKKKENSSA